MHTEMLILKMFTLYPTLDGCENLNKGDNLIVFVILRPTFLFYRPLIYFIHQLQGE